MIGNDGIGGCEPGLIVVDERKGDIVAAGPSPSPRGFPQLCAPSLLPSEAGRGLTNAQPQPYWRELDEGEVIGREFVVASCDPTTLLDVVDEPLDQISGTVEIRAEADQVVTIAFCGILAQTPLLAARALIQSAS
jgi:hypothetical protein